MHFPHNPKSAHTQIPLHAVGLWKATVGVISGQEAVLQVNHCLADFVVTIQEIIVVDWDFQVFVLGQETRHLKHPKQTKGSIQKSRGALDLPFKDNMVHIFHCLSFTPFMHLPSKHRTGGVGQVMVSVINRILPKWYLYVRIALSRRENTKQKVLTGPTLVRIGCLYRWLYRFILTLPLLSLGCRSVAWTT